MTGANEQRFHMMILSEQRLPAVTVTDVNERLVINGTRCQVCLQIPGVKRGDWFDKVIHGRHGRQVKDYSVYKNMWWVLIPNSYTVCVCF